AFSPDGTRLVTTRDSTGATVWDARTGTALFDLKGRPVTMFSVAYSPDGTRIVTGGYRNEKPNEQTGEATLWGAQRGAPWFDLPGHHSALPSVVFTPDGTRIVTRRYNGAAKVWDARTGKELQGEGIPVTVEPGPVSPDGSVFAHKDGNRVELIS